MTIIRRAVIALWLPILLVLLWWFASASSTSLFFPPLADIVSATNALWIWDHTIVDLLPSLRNMLLGLGIATALGVALGLVLGSFPRLLATFDPGIELFRALPAVAILPVAILVLGLGDSMRVFVIVLGAVWPVLINTTAAVRGIDPTTRDVEAAFRLSAASRFLRVRLPAALPQILAGVRVALYISVALIVVSEMQGAGVGIGHFLLASQRNWAITDMWTGMVVLGFVGYGLSILFRFAERALLRAYPPQRLGKD
ncbi:ABC transporter permease [Agromyces subbeticus]|uniref:ABC transporter permease n=1 Tax=Agromyces subbeticus TaxID=293890 RepID=UPI0003B3D568|nr:ABC transporter permease [Agromyces subbeticus]